ncbi:hypothetical protein [Variovorax paradoxus]|uniref:hypothetical protein n=1 Tax=Variovorax paradoxus TaxID=34073 RepID=UPI0027863F92|nr:hypothetical protein [Variovorax paradoxus]MDP9933587.1 hypothetical protein [Variovorax paradoxus]
MSTPRATFGQVPRDVDVRGFVYALDPICQKQQWNMDKLLIGLARAQQALTSTETDMAQVLHMHDQQAEETNRSFLLRVDPGAHRHALSYLASLRGQWKQLGLRRQTQLAARDRLRRECVAQQLRLDGLAQHRADALTQYADEVRQRNSVEQDRDWLARLALARGSALEIMR